MSVHVTLTEWSELRADTERGHTLRGVTLNKHAQAAAQQLTEAGMLEILDLRDGLTIRSTSYVGAVQLGDLSIHIRPKIAFDVMLALFRYAYGLRDLRLYQPTEQSVSEYTFQDLLIQQLAAEANELLARGLHRRYMRVDEALSLPRGKIDMGRIAQNGGVIEAALPCIHHPRLEDNLINQVLLAGLHLGARLTTQIDLRVQLRRLASQLETSVTAIRLNRDTLDRLGTRLSRLTAAYDPAFTLITLLVEGFGVSLESREQTLSLPGFLFDMNHFFEALLSRFLRENLPVPYVLEDQFKLRGMMSYVVNPQRRQAPTPRPDYVVKCDGQVVAMLDAKYRDLWANGLPREMLYQLAIYALSQGSDGCATILYPTLGEDAKPEVIEIRELMYGGKLAQVVLCPVNLVKLRELIDDRTPQGTRKQSAFSFSLAFNEHQQLQMLAVP